VGDPVRPDTLQRPMEDVMRMLAALVSLTFATTALAADPASAAPAPNLSAPETYGKPAGLIPYTLIGPKLAVLPIPGVYGVGLEAKFLNLVGVGIDYNAFPTVKLGDVKAGYNDLSFNARVFPWKGRFYLGAAVGSRSFSAKATDSASGQEIKVEVKSTYIAPELGWRFVWTSGFFMGIDLGYQIVLSPKTTLTLPAVASVDPTDKKNVQDAGDQIGKIGLPIVSLLQFGFYL
jgi:hypothetical protein